VARIFLCHRGEESPDIAGRLGDRLRAEFGERRVVQPSEVNPAAGRNAAKRCDVVVLVLGHRPQFEGNDVALFAVELALKRRRTVILALVAGAGMPAERTLPESIRPAFNLNGLAIHPDPHFDRDVARLIAGVRRPSSLSENTVPGRWLPEVLPRCFGRMVAGISVAGIFAVAVCLLMLYQPGALVDYEKSFLIAWLFGIPTALGLLFGLRHSFLGGLIGFLFGLMVAWVQPIVLAIPAFASSVLVNMVCGLRTDRREDVVLIAWSAEGTSVTCALLMSAWRARRRAKANVPIGTGPTPRGSFWYGCLVGLIVGGLVGGATSYFCGTNPKDNVGQLLCCLSLYGPALFLFGAEFGWLDVALERRRLALKTSPPLRRRSRVPRASWGGVGADRNGTPTSRRFDQLPS
jgi:hypothetical protein